MAMPETLFDYTFYETAKTFHYSTGAARLHVEIGMGVRLSESVDYLLAPSANQVFDVMYHHCTFQSFGCAVIPLQH